MDYPLKRCRAALIAACLAVVTAGCASAPTTPTAPAAPAAPAAPSRDSEAQPAKDLTTAPPQATFAAPHGLPVTVKEIGPAEEAVDLQVVTLFNQASKQKFVESMTDLDSRLGGFVTKVRDSGQFQANALDTLVITPPPGAIAARRLLFVGLGDSSKASLDLMNKVGTVVAREAVRLHAPTVAFAPTLRDQSFDKLDTGQVGAEFITGAILGYDTEARLQQQDLDPCFALKHLYYEAGASYFSDVVEKVGPAVQKAVAQVSSRSDQPFGKSGPKAGTCHT
ncbi:M17 family peptidase N-terminal domain-containing protein [Streptomyces sp. NRRL B-24720]|uniref:M17 family peptidase N-terminal domain-containing protein n=1 Tax=Streptomyces sp. NRRL B-24720 TaxID=1476876 RepID=UPI00069100A1|nr:M17 family peptidase N-terminal domain-containing protein [Streptomyces sp. NRRL B-24720]